MKNGPLNGLALSPSNSPTLSSQRSMNHSRISAVLTSLCLLLAPAFLNAQESTNDDSMLANWHQFRGPLANGVAPKAKSPTTWSESSNVQWKFDIPGEGSSTPIVFNDSIYLTAATKTEKTDPKKTPPDDQPRNGFFNIKFPNHFYQFDVICVHRKTGKLKWKKTAIEAVPNEGRHPDNNFASASPTTDGERLYVSFGSQGFYCYSLDGDLLWKRDLGKIVTRNNFGEGASLTVAKGHLIIVRDNETRSAITVVNSKTGKTIWEKERDEPSCWATPIVVEQKGKTHLITNGHTRVRSYELSTGDLIWECGGQVMNVTPCPVVHQDSVICMSGYRGNSAMSIQIDSSGDVTASKSVNWQLQEGTPYIPSPILVDGLVYFTKSNNNILTCVDAETGEIVYDRKRLPQIRSMYASPTSADGKIYFQGRGGTTVVIAAGRQYKVLATNKVEDSTDASPVPVGNQLLIRGKKKLYSIAQN